MCNTVFPDGMARCKFLNMDADQARTLIHDIYPRGSESFAYSYRVGATGMIELFIKCILPDGKYREECIE